MTHPRFGFLTGIGLFDTLRQASVQSENASCALVYDGNISPQKTEIGHAKTLTQNGTCLVHPWIDEARKLPQQPLQQ